MEITQAKLANCAHCGSSFSGPSLFCCSGCESVYAILKKNNLLHYYDLKNANILPSCTIPIENKKENFSYLSEESSSSMQFYLEGIHCIGCLWLIEKLPSLLPGIKRAQLNYGQSIVTVHALPETNFALVAEKLESLGYRPHPILNQQNPWEEHENKMMLARVGIAAACAGNIMLLAISVYGGATGSMAELFHWISFGLSLPVLTFCAWPFYENAWQSIRQKTLSIDFPIVLALLAGIIVSIKSLLTHKNEIYFDSLSSLVFLLLASRYFLKRMMQTQFHFGELLHTLLPRMAKVFNGVRWEEKKIEALQQKEIIAIAPYTYFPADGLLESTGAQVSSASLTGENTPHTIRRGDLVYAGMMNEGEECRISITALGKNSRLGKILHQVQAESQNKGRLVSFAATTAKYFVVGVMITATALFLCFLPTNIEEGLRRALALVIVTCPCVLALAIPLVVSKCLAIAARRGIIMKDADCFERLSRAKNIFFDKTGTLTEGQFSVKSWLEESNENDEIKSAVFALEKNSHHPVAKALLRYLAPKISTKLPEVHQHKEILAQGVQGKINGVDWEVRKINTPDIDNWIGVFRDNTLVARAILGDKLRPEAPTALKALQKLGLKTILLSGDQEKSVRQVAAQLEIPATQVIANATPEQKCTEVKRHPEPSIMVGDGANDAVAFAASSVGIAVHGSMEMSLQCADVYISRPGIRSIVDLIKIARESQALIYRNFGFSLFYNLVSGSLAIMGFMSPLRAAILMPVSALTIYISTMIGTRILRNLERESAA